MHTAHASIAIFRAPLADHPIFSNHELSHPPAMEPKSAST
jgi:hypothetical protein